MARPLKEINWEYVEKMIEAGCSAKEISGKYRIDNDTFYIRFKKQFGCRFQDYQAIVAPAGDGQIRTMQYAKALNNKAPGSPQMLMYLGKVLLGQREPDNVSSTPPQQNNIDKDHVIMQQEHLIATLREQLAAHDNKPQTE